MENLYGIELYPGIDDVSYIRVSENVLIVTVEGEDLSDITSLESYTSHSMVKAAMLAYRSHGSSPRQAYRAAYLFGALVSAKIVESFGENGPSMVYCHWNNGENVINLFSLQQQEAAETTFHTYAADHRVIGSGEDAQHELTLITDPPIKTFGATLTDAMCTMSGLINDCMTQHVTIENLTDEDALVETQVVFVVSNANYTVEHVVVPRKTLLTSK